jgi:small ligand-binding sensory domain FIST
MSGFLSAHATHPDPQMALALVAAQIEGQRAQRSRGFTPTLGLVYLTEAAAAEADAVLDELRRRWPGTVFAGAGGAGVIGSGAEYFEDSAISLLLTDLDAGQFQVFNGRRPLDPAQAFSALVHADAGTQDLAELIAELSERTQSGYLFGGLAVGGERAVHLADGVFDGGLSGVGFGPGVTLVSRVTQGCLPVGPVRRITACERNVVIELDGRPALPLLLSDIGHTLDRPEPALRALRGTLVGMAAQDEAVLGRGGQFGTDTRVRHLIGIDPGREAVAIGDLAAEGEQLAFCRRDAEAARRDLVRICSEIREEVDLLAPDRPVPPCMAAPVSRGRRRSRGRSTCPAPVAVGRISGPPRPRPRSSSMPWATCP